MLSFQSITEGFPGGSLVENPPANEGQTGSIPGPKIPHMPRSNWAHAPQLLKSEGPWASALQREATAMRSPHAAAEEQPPLATTREKPAQQQRPDAGKTK